MQRYKKIEDVVIGNRIVFDNTIGLLKDVPKIKLVGEVKEVLDNGNVLVSYILNTSIEPIELETPFFLLQ